MKFLVPLFIAVRFLTWLPVPAPKISEVRDVGYSLVYYPVVGLLLGFLLAALCGLLEGSSPLLVAALLLVFWIGVTGGLHLDGLADSADAWVGGLGDRERTLAIMKDPRSGPAAIVGICGILVIKFAALTSIIATDDKLVLLLAPTVGRLVLPVLFLTTPYVRPGGLGSILAQQRPRRAILVMTVIFVGGTLIVGGLQTLLPLLATTGLFIVLRIAMLRRIGGTTGDTAGALVELTEATMLIAFALSHGESAIISS